MKHQYQPGLQCAKCQLVTGHALLLLRQQARWFVSLDSLAAATAPAVTRTHCDLATYLAELKPF